MTDTPNTITREEADARVAAALREAALIGASSYGSDMDAEALILTLIPDAGASFDRAIAEAVRAEREACALVAFDLLCGAGEPGTAAIVSDAIRARTEGEG